MKRILIFLALLLAAYVSFSQSPIHGRLRVISGTYDNYFQNGTDTFKLGWRTDRFQLKYNTNKRFIDLIKSDSTVIIYNKLILESPNDTMLSVRGNASFVGDAMVSGNFSGGGTNTVSGNSFAYGDSCIVSGENNFVSGISNIVGAKAFLIQDVTDSPAEIILESSEGNVTSDFTAGTTIYAENYNDGSNFMVATINTSSFNGTNTVLTINENITNIYDNWYYYIVIFDTMTSGSGNHIEGIQNRIYNGSYGAHVEGGYNTSNGLYCHSEGSLTTASGEASHAEGKGTTASGSASHAEGYETTASGIYSHAEGYRTTASGDYSHAEGYETTASGDISHAAGYETTASGAYSHAEGALTTASGYYSQAFGLHTKADASTAFVCGAYNDTLQYENNYNWYSYDPLFQIGNGLADTTRNDAFRILKNGKTFIGDSSSTTDAILVVDPTDSTSAFIGNVSITDTTFMEHLTVTDSVTLETALFDIYNLAPDSDSLIVADDGIINLRTGAYGELRVWVFNAGMYAEYAVVILNVDGSIGIMTENSANVTNVGGTDGNLNIYDAGAYTTIENKLGGSRTIKYVFTH